MATHPPTHPLRYANAPALGQPHYTDERIRRVATRHPARISAWVRANAKRQGIRYQNTRYAKLAEAISRLSDSDAKLDDTEELLVALSKAKVLTISQLGMLQVSYLRHDASQSGFRPVR